MINKEQVKEDIERWAKRMSVAVELLRLNNDEMNIIYKEVAE